MSLTPRQLSIMPIICIIWSTRGISSVPDRGCLESLRSGETFVSALWLERKGPRFIFHQDILKTTGELVTTACVTCVMIRDGKLSRGDEVAELFKKFL